MEVRSEMGSVHAHELKKPYASQDQTDTVQRLDRVNGNMHLDERGWELLTR